MRPQLTIEVENLSDVNLSLLFQRLHSLVEVARNHRRGTDIQVNVAPEGTALFILERLSENEQNKSINSNGDSAAS